MSDHETTWTRRNGERVPIDHLKLDELREARLELMHGDLGEPGTRALFEAVNHAIEHYAAGDGPDHDRWPQAA